MKNRGAVCALLLLACSAAGAADPKIVAHGRFKEVALYAPAGEVKSVVLFLSGDGGWNAGVIDMARALVAHGALVAGVSTPALLKSLDADGGACVFPDGDLENLSHFVQAYLKLPTYLPPVIVGYSSGATLGYAVMAQAPAGTFAGALVLGFCPDLALHKPLCKGEGVAFEPRRDGKGIDLLPGKLGGPLTVLHGEIDQVCDAHAAQAFLDQVPTAHLVLLPKVGHGYSVERNWMPQFLAGFDALAAQEARQRAPAPPEIGDLPVVEVPATGPSGDALAVLISGDGGWAGLDRAVAQALAARGVPVAGIDSLRYFWSARTPEGFASDLARVLRYYLAQWHKDAVWLIGYSQGGDVLPFALNRLPADLRAKVKLAAPLAPAEKAAFEFHLANWVGGHGDLPLAPEMDKLKGDSVLVCIYGRDEGGSICPTLDASAYRVVGLPGGHHFNGDYQKIADTLLQSARP